MKTIIESPFAQKPTTIFIVDDNQTFTIALKANIENSFPNKDLNIHTFLTGEACMKKLKEEKPEIVILDYHMSSNNLRTADGISVLDRVKKEDPDIDVIMLTGDDHIDIAIKSFKHGASDYIVKSESQPQKIKYSLLNIFKLREARRDAKKYQRLFMMLAVGTGLVIGSFGATWMYAPHLFR